MSSRRSETIRYTLRAFERFCGELVLDNGERLTIEPFQRAMLRDHFAGVRELVILIPEGNGKTTLLAALMLFHLANWPDAEVIIVASSREQAEILYRQATGLVERSGLGEVFDVRQGYRIIRLRGSSRARARVLAAVAGTADGVVPTLVLGDELHRWPDRELYGVLHGKLGKRNGQIVSISTAGYRLASFLGELRQRAHAMDGFRRRGMKNTVRAPAFSWVEWCLADSDDPTDMAAVKRANPASFVTPAWLREKHDSPRMTAGQWARYSCGIWSEGEEPWIVPAEWDRLGVDIGGVEAGEEVWLAVHGAIGSAIAIVAKRGDGIACRSEILGEAPLEIVERRLVELAELYDVRQIAYDRVAFTRSAELLAGRGLPMVEIPCSPERLSIVSTTLLRLINAGELRHDGDPELRAHVLAGATTETGRGWRLLPAARCRALIALAIAAHEATSVAPEAPAFVAL